MARLKLTSEQEEFIDKLELAVAELVHDGNTKLATSTSIIVEWLQKGEFVIACLEAEYMNFPAKIVDRMRQLFDVRKFSEMV